MKNTVIGLAACLMLNASGGISAASVVVYDNSDQTFLWKLGVQDIDGTPYPGTFLDITQPSTQSGEQKPGTMGKWYFPNVTSDEPAERILIGESGVQSAKTTDEVIIKWNDEYAAVFPTRDYAPGEFVTPADNWDVGSTYFWHLPFHMGFEGGTPGIGDPAYLGVRVKMADNQWHYGWILFAGYDVPLMWAYETEANVLIGIPVPSPWPVHLFL